MVLGNKLINSFVMEYFSSEAMFEDGATSVLPKIKPVTLMVPRKQNPKTTVHTLRNLKFHKNLKSHSNLCIAVIS